MSSPSTINELENRYVDEIRTTKREVFLDSSRLKGIDSFVLRTEN